MDTLLNLSFSPWLLAKIAALFALLIYIIFAFVIVRQVNIMLKTLDVGFETQLKLVAWSHLFFAIGTFVLALMIL